MVFNINSRCDILLAINRSIRDKFFDKNSNIFDVVRNISALQIGNNPDDAILHSAILSSEYEIKQTKIIIDNIKNNNNNTNFEKFYNIFKNIP